MAQPERDFDILKKYDLNSDESSEKVAAKKANLDDFDQLWNVTIDQTLDFVEKKEKTEKSVASEITLLKAELKEKDFEVQKFKWQIKERERELKKLYDEADEIMSLNRQLNDQLELYSYIEKENFELKEIGRYVAKRLKETQVENNELTKELRRAEQKVNTEPRGVSNLWGVIN